LQRVSIWSKILLEDTIDALGYFQITNMKRSVFLRIFFVAAIVMAFAICLGNICDDDDAGLYQVCLEGNLQTYDRLIASSLSDDKVFSVCEAESPLRESIVLYLQLHQKSPPSCSVCIFA